MSLTIPLQTIAYKIFPVYTLMVLYYLICEQSALGDHVLWTETETLRTGYRICPALSFDWLVGDAAVDSEKLHKTA